MSVTLEPVSKTDWKMHLPPEFAAQLRAMHPPDNGYRRRVPPTELRDTLAAARAKGWTLQSLADALGLTRERVRQLVEDVWPGSNTFEIPEPPPRPLTRREQKRLASKRDRDARPTLNAEQRDELLTLRRKANAGGNCAPDHPAIVAGCELTALIQRYLDEGYRSDDIASACRVTRAAIYLRLGRYGYRSLPPSQPPPCGPVAIAVAERAVTS